MLAISCSEDEYKRLRKPRTSKEKWVAIQIASTEDEAIVLTNTQKRQFEEVLQLYFTDIKEPILEGEIEYKPFSKEQYLEVLDFYDRNKSYDKLFVQCTMGIQRSAGIVHGLGVKYGINIQHGMEGNAPVHPYPNVVEFFY